VSATLSGLKRGHPALSFKLGAGRGAPKLTTVMLALPRGLSLRRHRVHHRLVLQGVSLRNARIQSMRLRGGKLTITLRAPSATVLVRITSRALRESSGLRSKARRHRIRYLTLRVTMSTTAHHHRVTVTRAVKPKS
jgi:hypothetical protein